MVLVCKAQASTWWLDTLLVCLASGQVFTSVWSCLLPIFWDPLLANTKSGIDTKDINLLRQIKKHPSASNPSLSKKPLPCHVLLGAFSLQPSLPDPAILTSNVSTRTSAVTKGQRGVGNFTKSTSRKFCWKRSRFLAS